MKKELSTYKHEVTAPGTIDPEEAAKLAALGYLGSTAATPAGPLPDPKDNIGQIVAMMEATQLEREGRVREAIAKLEAVLKENPRFSDAWNMLARDHELLGEWEAAAAAYRTGDRDLARRSRTSSGSRSARCSSGSTASTRQRRMPGSAKRRTRRGRTSSSRGCTSRRRSTRSPRAR